VPTSGSPLDEFLAIVRRDLGADEARILEPGEAEPAGGALLECALPGGRRLVAVLPAPAPDAEARRRRLQMLADSFHSVLAGPDRARPSRPPPARSLHEELAALARRAGAVDAVVIDARSPVVWGTAGEERAAPSLAPAADSAERMRASGGARAAAERTEVARLSRQYGLASIEGLWMDPRAVELVPRALCDRHRIVPVAMNGSTLVIGMADPRNADALHDVVLVTGLHVDPVIAGESMLALYARWNDGRDTRTYDEVIAAIPADERETRERDAAAARAGWARHLGTRRAVTAVRALPETGTLHKGGQLHSTVTESRFGYVARSFAAIYVLILVFDEPFDELGAKRAMVAALPGIERLVVALPPLDPAPTLAGVVALRGRRRKR
jgi:Type II secretion system (T2SS), protein E, N-terminal domain